MTTTFDRGFAMLSEAGDALLDRFAMLNAWAFLLFATAFVLDRLLSSRMSASLRILLYAPVFLRLALPDAWQIQLSLPGLPVVAPTSEPTTIAAGSAAALTLGASADASTAALRWTAMLPIAYFVGVTALLVHWTRERRRLLGVLRESSNATPELQRLCQGLSVVLHASAGPLLIGTRRPRLVLPVGLIEQIGASGFGAVIAHERSHIERRDPILVAALHLCVILAWPIAAVWFAASRIRTLIEVACDERALSGASSDARRGYGQALIELATGRSRSEVALAFGDGLRERITSLHTPSTRWSAGAQRLVALVACLMLVACGSTLVTKPPAESSPPASDRGSVPILSDLPIVGNAGDAKGNPGGRSEYPQILCMMNLIEAEGPLYFAKDGVVESGRNDGPGHRVQPGNRTIATFDWFARMRGYTNLAAPAILVGEGASGTISVGATDKAGQSVGGNEVTVRFVDDGQGGVRADVRWLVGDGSGALVEAHQAQDVPMGREDALIILLPAIPGDMTTGRILMLRPSVIRSQTESPRQTAAPLR
jgi:beta-lactamase regulating signal transducer with metallopeptidase domain